MECFYTVAIFMCYFYAKETESSEFRKKWVRVQKQKITQFFVKDIVVAESNISKNRIKPTPEQEQDTNRDTQLHGKVNKALQHNPYITGSKLSFEASQGRVTLRGVVLSFFQKQMAQESLRTIEGIDEILNELEVLGKKIRVDERN